MTSGAESGVVYVRPASSSVLSSAATVSTARCSQSVATRAASSVMSEPGSHRSCHARITRVAWRVGSDSSNIATLRIE